MSKIFARAILAECDFSTGVFMTDENNLNLPLVYVPPPGWPMPTHAWMRDNQGVLPDSAPMAAAGLPPAPAGWRFWVEREVLIENLNRRSLAPAIATQGHESRPGLGTMIIGFAICGIGVMITAGTYFAAGPGGVYVVTWGAIVFGAIQGLRGLIMLVRGY